MALGLKGDETVRVVVPVYRAQDTIDRCLNGILANLFTQTRLVLAVDDDADYASFVPDHPLLETEFRRTTNVQSGPSAARNLAMEGADETFIAFCDADDVWGPDRLEALCGLAARHGAAIDNTTLVDIDGKTIRDASATQTLADIDGKTIRDANATQTVAGPLELGTLVSARLPFFSVIRNEPGLPEWPEVQFAEDLLFNLGLFERFDMQYCPATTYFYYENPNSITGSANIYERMQSGYEEILDGVRSGRWLSRPDVKAKLTEQLEWDAMCNREYLAHREEGETVYRFLKRRWPEIYGEGA